MDDAVPPHCEGRLSPTVATGFPLASAESVGCRRPVIALGRPLAPTIARVPPRMSTTPGRGTGRRFWLGRHDGRHWSGWPRGRRTACTARWCGSTRGWSHRPGGHERRAGRHVGRRSGIWAARLLSRPNLARASGGHPRRHRPRPPPHARSSRGRWRPRRETGGERHDGRRGRLRGGRAAPGDGSPSRCGTEPTHQLVAVPARGRREAVDRLAGQVWPTIEEGAERDV